MSYHRAAGDIAYVLSNKIVFFGITTTDQHPPLYFLLVHFALSLFGNSEFALRAASAFSAVLAVPLSYVLGTRLFDEKTGLLTAALAAFSPFYLYYAQEARPYALAATLGMASAYFFVRCFVQGGNSFYPVYLVTLLASVLVHYLTVFIILADAAYVALDSLLKRKARRLVALGGIAALGIILAPAAQYVLFRFTILGDSRLQVPIVDVFRDLAISFTFGITVNQFEVLPYALGLVGVALAGVVACFASTDRDRPLFMLARLGLPAALFYGISLFKVIYNTRYAAFLAPMFYLLLAAGLAFLLRKTRPIGVLACAYVLVIGGFGTYHYFAAAPLKANLRDSIGYIMEQAKPGDAVVLADARLKTAFDFYFRGSQPLYAVPSSYSAASPEAISTQLSDIAREHSRMWTILWIASDMDPEGLTWKTLDERSLKLDERTFSSKNAAVTLRLYSAQTPTVDIVPRDAKPIDVNFDNRVALVAYRLERVDAGSRRQRITLFWRAQQPELARYKMFGQLIDAQGNTWADFDGEPFYGFYPTTLWKQGEVVADERVLEVTPGAPPGSYRLRLGIRDADGVSLPARFADLPPKPLVEVEGPELQPTMGAAALAPQSLARYYDADFEGRLVLVGSDLSPRTLRPGDTLDLRLFWRSKQGVPEGLKAKLTLTSADGLETILTEEPVSTLYSPASWKPGELVGAGYKVIIPQGAVSGKYHVDLSVSEPGAAQPLSVRSGWSPFSASRIELASLEVQGFERLYELPPMQLPLGADFVGIRALGLSSKPAVDADPGGMTPSVPHLVLRGSGFDSLGVSIFWQPLLDINRNYKVFVQLLDDSGKLVLQHDSMPQAGARSTRSWLAGEVIEDYHELSDLDRLVPGAYTLITGLYEEDTGERLKLADGPGDYITLLRVIVQH